MKKALEKLEDARKSALGAIVKDPRSRAGLEMKRRHAEMELPKLKEEFDVAFGKVAFPILVKGTKAMEFFNLVQTETECVYITDPLQNIKRLVALSMGPSKTFNVNAYSILARELRQIAKEANMVVVPAIPDFIREVYSPAADLISDVVNTYVSKIGPSFMKVLIERDASAKAEGLTGTQPVVPVLISVDWMSQEFFETVVPLLFNCNGKFVEVDTDVNVPSNELVISTLKNIKKSLKEKK
jgi:hypothetical protein